MADAVGAYVEMTPYIIDDMDLQNALNMIGGGSHEISSGQVTDDSEMAMSLMWALIATNQQLNEDEERYIDVDIITKFYIKWLKSEPFDIDSTVNFAMDPLKNDKNPQA